MTASATSTSLAAASATEIINTPSAKTVHMSTSVHPPIAVSNTKKRKLEKELSAVLASVDKEISDCHEVDDEAAQFGRSIATKMRNFDRYTFALARRQIEILLFDLEFGATTRPLASGFPPQPVASTLAPHASGFPPQPVASTLAPQVSGLAAQASGFAPQPVASVLAPQVSGLAPQASGFAPQPLDSSISIAETISSSLSVL